jgi:hypothetical protein
VALPALLNASRPVQDSPIGMHVNRGLAFNDCMPCSYEEDNSMKTRQTSQSCFAIVDSQIFIAVAACCKTDPGSPTASLRIVNTSHVESKASAALRGDLLLTLDIDMTT